jgi:hypothetical protein
MSIPPGGAPCPPRGAPHSFWTGLADHKRHNTILFADALQFSAVLMEEVGNVDAGERVCRQQSQGRSRRRGAQGATEFQGRGGTPVATRVHDDRGDIFGKYGHAMTITPLRQYSTPEGGGYRPKTRIDNRP